MIPADANLGFFLALTTAFCWSLTSVFLRRAMVSVSPLQSTLAASLVGVFILSLIIVISGEFKILTRLSTPSIIYAALSGVITFAAGRYLWYSGISLIGASRANSIVALETLFAPAIAITVLQETLNPILALAIASVFIGVIFISRSMEHDLNKIVVRRKIINGLAMSFAAAVIFSIGAVLTRIATSLIASPLVAYLLGVTASSLSLLPAAKNINWGRNEKWIILVAAITQTTAGVAYWSALSIAPVIVVVPVSQSYPLFTLILSYAMIRQLEFLNKRTVVGVFLITVGIVAMLLRTLSI